MGKTPKTKKPNDKKERLTPNGNVTKSKSLQSHFSNDKISNGLVMVKRMNQKSKNQLCKNLDAIRYSLEEAEKFDKNIRVSEDNNNQKTKSQTKVQPILEQPETANEIQSEPEPIIEVDQVEYDAETLAYFEFLQNKFSNLL